MENYQELLVLLGRMSYDNDIRNMYIIAIHKLILLQKEEWLKRAQYSPKAEQTLRDCEYVLPPLNAYVEVVNNPVAFRLTQRELLRSRALQSCNWFTEKIGESELW